MSIAVMQLWLHIINWRNLFLKLGKQVLLAFDFDQMARDNVEIVKPHETNVQ